MIRASATLLARLWPLLSAAASVSACANKPASDAPATPPAAPSVATPATATSQATAVPTTPRTTTTTAATGTGSVVPLATASTASSARTLLPCRNCDLHCYAHAPGEKCLPGETGGASLDARVGCLLHDRAGPSDDGKQCCYGQPCVGRPLLRDNVVVLAPLLSGGTTAAWG